MKIVIGTIYADIENGEGSIVMNYRLDQIAAISRADIMRDILGDATTLYDRAVDGLRQEWRAAHEKTNS